MTATVSAMVMASSWSWVTWRKVRPTSSWIVFSSSCICRRSFRSSAPSGSSSSSSAGRLTIARASATRCCCRPRAARAPLREVVELDEPERLVRLAERVVDAPSLQPERHVVDDRHVREQGIALEHGVDRALVRRVSVTSLPPMRMRPLVGSSSPATRRSVVVLPQPDGRAARRTIRRGSSGRVPRWR